MPVGNPLEREKNIQVEEISPRQRKMAVIFLAILTIAVVALSVLQFHTKLNAPFAVSEKASDTTEIATSTDPKLKDSDGDGLSDYDEVNIYKTSPYLPDSDSDGISDKDEIAAGTDPNCPTGKTCDTADTAVDSTSSSTVNSIAGDLITAGETTAIGEATTTTGTVASSSTGEVTPDFLRQILIQNGSDTSTVNKISDEDIMSAYQEAEASQASSSNQ
jgi:hypothetical protein